MIDVAEASAADAAEIGAFIRSLWRAAGPDAPGLTGATDEVIAEISTPEALTARLEGSDHRIFLARRDGRVVGFAATRRLSTDEIELAGIMVHPDHQGGVGTPLLEAAVRAARPDGYLRMRVATEVDNVGALGFYRARGFAPLRRATEDVVGSPVEVWELALEF
jgi:ribosomal-protein-alanine N-acetyltransferase